MRFRFVRLFTFLVFLLPLNAFASEPAEPFALRCLDPQRAIDGDRMSITCTLELTYQGHEPLHQLVAVVHDKSGATVELDRFAIGDLSPRTTVEMRDPFTFSFDYRHQEPPRIEWRLQYTDLENKRGSTLLSM